MFVIFGWPKRKRDERPLITSCSGCQRATVHQAFSEQSWFSFFFIPIFPIGPKQPHAICSVCGQDVHAPTVRPVGPPGIRNEAAQLLTGGAAYRPTKHCPACAEAILLEAASCRFCGRKFTAEEIAQAGQDYQAQLEVAASAGQQAELARQQQRRIRRFQGRYTRRRVFGLCLIGVGALMLLLMIAMFFSSPAPGNTREQQQTAALVTGLVLGLMPLAVGIALLRASKSAERSLRAEQNRLMPQSAPPPLARP